MVKTIKLFVEGGGDRKSLRTECRSGFCSFLEKAGMSGLMPRIVASGSRNAAYKDYFTAIMNGEDAVLLIDSEAEIIVPMFDESYDADDLYTWKPWHHLTSRRNHKGEFVDIWEKPSGASDLDCHLMVQSMETWFLADVDVLKRYYGRGFREKSLPDRSEIESVPKDTVMSCLCAASNDTRKGYYDKGAHSFEILSRIDPHKVISRSPWTRRFITILYEKMLCKR
jgi:hypothetical protein